MRLVRSLLKSQELFGDGSRQVGIATRIRGRCSAENRSRKARLRGLIKARSNRRFADQSPAHGSIGRVAVLDAEVQASLQQRYAMKSTKCSAIVPQYFDGYESHN